LAVKSLSGILKQTSEIDDRKERIEFLRKNMNKQLAEIIKLTYNGKIEWDLPEGSPPFKPSEYDEPANLYREVKRFNIFVKGNYETMHKIKREDMFIKMLEYVDKEDAKLIVGMKDKKLPYPRLTEKFMKEALPELFDEKVS